MNVAYEIEKLESERARWSAWSLDKKRFFVLSLATLLLTASSSLAQDVRYNFDKSTDFSKFKTYKWVPIKGAAKVNYLVDKQVNAELATKGLTKIEGENADVYIGYQTAVGQEKQFNSYSTGWGYGPGWGAAGTVEWVQPQRWVDVDNLYRSVGLRHVRLSGSRFGLARSGEQNN